MLKPRRIFVFPIAVTFSVLFILYIISWFSPIAGDSFIHDRTGYLGQFHIRHVWKACVDSYLYWNPRLGEMAAFFITSAPRLVWTVLNPVFVLALVLGLYVLALGRMPDLRRECGAWTWLFALSMFISAGVTVYYVCLTRAGHRRRVELRPVGLTRPHGFDRAGIDERRCSGSTVGALNSLRRRRREIDILTDARRHLRQTAIFGAVV